MKAVRILAAGLCLGAAAVSFAAELDDATQRVTPIRLGQGGGYREDAVYDNLPGEDEGVFRSGANPARALDDGTFTGGPGDGGNLTVTGANFGFIVISTGNNTFDAQVNFYNTLDGEADPVNSDPLGGFRVSFEDVAPGAYLSGLLDTGGIYFPDNDWAVDIIFLQPGSENLATGVTVAFDGTGVNVGTSEDDACADVGHWARNGLNPADCLKKLEGHVYGVHLKDIVKFDDPQAADTVVSKGIIDFPSIFAELKRQRFNGMLAIEHESNWLNNLPDVIETVKYYNEQVAKLQ